MNKRILAYAVIILSVVYFYSSDIAADSTQSTDISVFCTDIAKQLNHAVKTRNENVQLFTQKLQNKQISLEKLLVLMAEEAETFWDEVDKPSIIFERVCK